MKTVKIDKTFLLVTLLLIVVGFLIFASAALGLLAGNGATYSSVAFNHIVFGLLGGGVAMVITSKLDYKLWRRYAFYFYIISLVMTLLVFVPHLGVAHGGARRWIQIAGVSFQPGELLKIGFIIYLAAWLAAIKDKAATFKYGMVPFLVLSGVTGIALIAQPDTDGFMVIFAAGISMFLSAGAKLKHLAVLGLSGILCIAVLAFARPYVMQRIKTFVNPASDPQGSGYQIQQSLIAIGSGGLTGRGFGQSIQKFNFLPEPIGDSIFAVAAEEFGFIGSTILIFLFTFFGIKGLKIAARAPDTFSGLLVIGIVILIISQSFLNIGAMLGVLPLSGLPLLFVSHGGSAMLVVMALTGIILNISKYQRS